MLMPVAVAAAVQHHNHHRHHFAPPAMHLGPPGHLTRIVEKTEAWNASHLCRDVLAVASLLRQLSLKFIHYPPVGLHGRLIQIAMIWRLIRGWPLAAGVHGVGLAVMGSAVARVNATRTLYVH